MGGLLSTVLAEHSVSRLTKSRCTCQGKKHLSRKSISRRIPPGDPQGKGYIDWNGATMEFITGIFVANQLRNIQY